MRPEPGRRGRGITQPCGWRRLHHTHSCGLPAHHRHRRRGRAAAEPDRSGTQLMADKQEEKKETEATPVEVECPKCGHKFWHKLKGHLKDALDGLGNAIGEAKFG